MQNRFLHYITIVCFAAISFAFAFENALFWQPVFREEISKPLKAYYLTGNPAAYLYEGNFQEIRIGGRVDKMDYRRRYDPVSAQNLNAGFYTVRHIDDRSFFSRVYPMMIIVSAIFSPQWKKIFMMIISV
ncbi:MAG: hypothetical protein U5N56_05715 [Candidatus Marinimicrobia bacterium]|nr:hypothetical protein [Candidatus Neomarinimicrobiota bacterium]